MVFPDHFICLASAQWVSVHHNAPVLSNLHIIETILHVQTPITRSIFHFILHLILSPLVPSTSDSYILLVYLHRLSNMLHLLPHHLLTVIPNSINPPHCILSSSISIHSHVHSQVSKTLTSSRISLFKLTSFSFLLNFMTLLSFFHINSTSSFHTLSQTWTPISGVSLKFAAKIMSSANSN